MKAKMMNKGAVQDIRHGRAQGRIFGVGGEDEAFFFVEGKPGLSFEQDVAELSREYSDALAAAGLDRKTSIYRRFFVSDAANQMEILKRSDLYKEKADKIAISVIQQRPLNGSKVAMFAYHVRSRGGQKKEASSHQCLFLQRPGVSQVWFTNLAEVDHGMPADRQTKEIFVQLTRELAAHDATLADNTVRTWVYVRDVDRHYRHMVDARREFFAAHGLTQRTHFIASTGIEGRSANPAALVSIDALSLVGLKPGQVSYLKAHDHLCDTIKYNVTFERGARIAYRDRVHYHISGTASIDKYGKVLHEGDVLRQTQRTLENMQALLADGGAKLADFMYILVYLRDPSDTAVVAQYLAKAAKGIPCLLLEAPVCRPQWLVEMEGVAVCANDDASLPAF